MNVQSVDYRTIVKQLLDELVEECQKVDALRGRIDEVVQLAGYQLAPPLSLTAEQRQVFPKLIKALEKDAGPLVGRLVERLNAAAADLGEGDAVAMHTHRVQLVIETQIQASRWKTERIRQGKAMPMWLPILFIAAATVGTGYLVGRVVNEVCLSLSRA